MKTTYRVSIIRPNRDKVTTDYNNFEKAEKKYELYKEKEREKGVEVFLTKHEKEGNMSVATSLKRQKYLRGDWQDYQPKRKATLLDWIGKGRF